MAVAQTKMILCKGNGSPILRCSGMKKDIEFYNSRSEFSSNNKVPFCKDCVQKIFEYYLELTGKFDVATYYTCQKLDIPFIIKIYEDILSMKKTNEEHKNLNKNYISSYISMLNKASVLYGCKLDFTFSDKELSEVDREIERREIEKKEAEAFKLDWGKQENEDYALLEYDFASLTDGISLSKPQEKLYRDLCLAYLAKRKAEQLKDDIDKDKKTASVQQIQNQILGLMKILRIDNFSENKELSMVERMLESRIAIQEKEKPTFHFEGVKATANSDFLGRGKYFYDHIYRPLKNQWSKNKLYRIVSKDKDELTDEDYEKIMKDGLDRKED